MKRPNWRSATDIRALPTPSSGNQVRYPDRGDKRSSVSGLAVRVTAAGARSFVAEKNTARGRIRITLGPAGTDALTLVQARDKARIALGLIVEGHTTDHIRAALERAEELIPSDAMSLQQVLDQYLGERRHKLAERTRSDYQQLARTHLADWRHRPIEAIDEAAVVAKFTSIKSPSRANYSFRLVRALFRYARSIRKDDGSSIVATNPVDVLSQRRLWHTNKRRRDVVGLHQLPPWWRAVAALAEGEGVAVRDDAGRFEEGTAALNADPETARDFLQFLLLTGLRKNEAASLRWETVDLAARMFTVSVTKNREPHTLPLSDYLLAMLQRRQKERGDDEKRAPYVFPGARGPLAEPKKMIAKVAAASGVPFSAHTLRRTFATIAESLDIPYLALKRFLNHKEQGVTGGYTVIDVERLREPMQKITDFILRAAGERKTSSVTVIEKQRASVPPH